MKMHHTIVGFGDLTYDHIFESRSNDLYYVCSRGGGSVFNLLANIAHWGGTAAAGGVGGNDTFGEAAKTELQKLCVDTSCISLLPDRTTLVIFEAIHFETQELWLRTRSSMSMTCPVCQSKASDNTLARVDRRNINLTQDWSNARFICFDRLTNERVEIAMKYRAQGIKTALDLGRSDFIRYNPATQVVAALDAFDVVITPKRVVESLAKRAGFHSIKSLCEVGPRMLMYVSNGSLGMTLYDLRKRPAIKITNLPPTQADTVIDDTGAGDAFFARILWELSKYDESLVPLEDYDYDSLVKITEDAITGLTPVLGAIGARGHIPVASQSDIPINPEWRGLTIHEIRNLIDSTQQCPFCGNTKVKPTVPPKRKTIGASVNLRFLKKRMLFAIERKDAISKCQEVLEGNGTVYTIGTGGSYPAALFLASLLNEYGSFFAQPIRPFDYIKIAKTSDYIIVISYSGATVDCAEAIRHARSIGVSRIILVTGATNPKLKELLCLEPGRDIIISYGRLSRNDIGPPKERGFVSIAGTVAPCALWTSAVVGPVKMTRFVQELQADKGLSLDTPTQNALKRTLKDDKTLAVFGGGLAWPAMLDLESKFAEAGLGNLQLHEVKDFSHGRFMSVIGAGQEKNPVIILHVGRWHDYEETLLNTLLKNRLVIVLHCEEPTFLGALKLLIDVQSFAQTCGTLLGKDISRPGSIPIDGLKLYRWKKGLD